MCFLVCYQSLDAYLQSKRGQRIEQIYYTATGGLANDFNSVRADLDMLAAALNDR